MISLICTCLMQMVMDPIHGRRFAMPNHWQYQRAILQEETGEEDQFEGDSEGDLCCRLEES